MKMTQRIGKPTQVGDIAKIILESIKKNGAKPKGKKLQP